MVDIFLRAPAANQADLVLSDPTAPDTAYTLAAEAGAFGVTGGAAVFTQAQPIETLVGRVQMRGADWPEANAFPRAAYRLQGATGRFTLTGMPAEMVYDRTPAMQRDDEEWVLLSTAA